MGSPFGVTRVPCVGFMAAFFPSRRAWSTCRQVRRRETRVHLKPNYSAKEVCAATQKRFDLERRETPCTSLSL